MGPVLHCNTREFLARAGACDMPFYPKAGVVLHYSTILLSDWRDPFLQCAVAPDGGTSPKGSDRKMVCLVKLDIRLLDKYSVLEREGVSWYPMADVCMHCTVSSNTQGGALKFDVKYMRWRCVAPL